ncbi:MAG: hypothetical protein J7623_26695 [Chitinophaga sp.]|uniref:hypothetical protein n=1 Tax=Chitinophaga sp. TaxID=1869181 RepID=UPI001B0785FC|nr:hypothetical protein [Chitinophaga sp.]MBO9732259.1 hypothetical protein [Chitinophaga sp.]
MSTPPKEMVMLLPAAQYAALGAVRCLPGLTAAMDRDELWLRGIPYPEEPHPLILQLPALHTWLLNDNAQLFPMGKLTPVATLKQLNWISLPELLPVMLPVSGMPALLPAREPVQLAPSAEPQSGNALLTTFDNWYQYANMAPATRLQALSFATSADRQVLIMGSPLPPIPGQEYVLQEQLLLPAGYSFTPPGITTIVNQQLNAAQTDLLLFRTNGHWERIPTTAFVKADRSAVRLTQKELEHG